MAVQSNVYTISGTTYSVTKPILAKGLIAVFLIKKEGSENVFKQLKPSEYEIVNNSVILKSTTSTSGYSQIEIRVADTYNELMTSTSDIATVSAISQEIIELAEVAEEIVTVTDNIELLKEAGQVAKDVEKVTQEPLQSAILNAETNAETSAIKATEAQLSAWVAEAEKMTADSYANEPENVFVKEYTSNGDGTFTSTDTTEYSALHFSRISRQVTVGDLPNTYSRIFTNSDLVGGKLSVTHNMATDRVVVFVSDNLNNEVGTDRVTVNVTSANLVELSFTNVIEGEYRVTILAQGGLDAFSPTVVVKSATPTEYILTITDKNGSYDTPNLKGQDGIDGDDGFAPTVVVKTENFTEYILTITDKNGSYDTPNLKGSGGGGGSLTPEQEAAINTIPDKVDNTVFQELEDFIATETPLETTNKTVVGAINEHEGDIKGLATDVGELKNRPVITVDTTLNNTSTNPIANNAVKLKFDSVDMELGGKANVNGDITKIFKVADGVDETDAVTKKQLDAIASSSGSGWVNRTTTHKANIRYQNTSSKYIKIEAQFVLVNSSSTSNMQIRVGASGESVSNTNIALGNYGLFSGGVYFNELTSSSYSSSDPVTVSFIVPPNQYYFIRVVQANTVNYFFEKELI